MGTPRKKAPAFIDEAEVVVSPRGRKTQTDPEVIDRLDGMVPGQAAVLDNFGNVPKSDRAKVGAIIRKNWKVAHPGTNCRIDYHPTLGHPQVRFAKSAE